MSFSIRTATFEDVAELKQLIPASVRSLSLGYYTEEQIESALRHMFGIDSQLLIDRTYLVAEHEGGIVGCGGWSKRNTLFGGDQAKEVDDLLLDPATDAGRIRAFFIHPQWARRGIGRKIIQTCEEAAKAEGFRRLELGATLPGEPLYSALGYQIVEPINLQLPDGILFPLYKMRKTLQSQ